MVLNTEALHAACLAVAKVTMWKPREEKKSTDKEVEMLVRKLSEIALDRLEFITGQGYDPNILVRAIRYLAHTHALPPMENDTRWFADMLDVLIELACPNANLPRGGRAFVTDLRRGLSAKLKM
jgi:hypothetical protein